ncbi:MAG: hypothetical protein KDB22_10470, partial [Planctomycetales bacterium]|nr:hypothetical protein [Planctomycetales bacterium]
MQSSAQSNRSTGKYSWIGWVLVVASCTQTRLVVLAAEPDVSQAISRSVSYLEERGDWWIEEKDCISCHRVSNMLWSLGMAKQAGFDVSRNLAELQEWILKSSWKTDDQQIPDAAKNKEGIAQLLVANQRVPFLNQQQVEAYIDLFVESQEPDGTWPPSGQLPAQKREVSETRDVSAAWIALAIAGDQRQTTQASLSKVLQTLAKRNSAVSTEWFAVRLLVSVKLADGLEQELVDKLVELQHDDGGWGWLTADESDALGTGLALYALASSRLPPPETLTRAENFLLSTQSADGSWQVRGTKKAKQKRVEETATYW